MYFTREDILKILRALLQIGIKDSEFKNAQLPLLEGDTITVVQDGANRKVKINDIIGLFNLLNRQDFINVSDMYDEHYITINEAIKLMPLRKRKEGLVITFQNTSGKWQIYQFKGTIDLFVNPIYWEDLFGLEYPIINSIIPDEEDLTISKPDEDGNSLLSFKDKDYDPEGFSGMATKILRKNIKEINGIKKNIITQEDFNKENCIYEIKYNFDLNEKIIRIPANCILKFNGGSFINGKIFSDNKTTVVINPPKIIIGNNDTIYYGIFFDVNHNELTYKFEPVKVNTKVLFGNVNDFGIYSPSITSMARYCGIYRENLMLESIITDINNVEFINWNYAPYYRLTKYETVLNYLENSNVVLTILRFSFTYYKDGVLTSFSTLSQEDQVTLIRNYVNAVKKEVDKYSIIKDKYGIEYIGIANEIFGSLNNSEVALLYKELGDYISYKGFKPLISNILDILNIGFAQDTLDKFIYSANIYPKIIGNFIAKKYLPSIDDKELQTIISLYVLYLTPYVLKCLGVKDLYVTECGCSPYYDNLAGPESPSGNFWDEGTTVLSIFYNNVINAIKKDFNIKVFCFWFLNNLKNRETNEINFNQINYIYNLINEKL